jgi:hypothetical protein
VSHNPFPGPQPYRASDRAWFFGREDMSGKLQGNILGNRCVAVYGPPGAGKSSLLQAAVLPALIDSQDVRVVRVDSWPSREDPTRWMARAMYTDLCFGELPSDLLPNEAILAAARRAARGSSRLMVLCLDQLEQLLFMDRTLGETELFFANLEELVELPLRIVRIVLSFREDYLGRFLDRLRDRRSLLEQYFRVGPLTVAELCEAVCKAAAAGEPAQTWSPDEMRPLMLQMRAPDQPTTDQAEVRLASAQSFCRALFEQRAQGEAKKGSASKAKPSVQQDFLTTVRDDNYPSQIQKWPDEEPLATPAGEQEPRHLAPALKALLCRPFTMVLGDLDEDQIALRRELAQFMEDNGDKPEASTSLTALTQQCVLRFGHEVFHTLFQQAITGRREPLPPLVEALGRLIPPGAHITLLWRPYLERALARHQPGRTLYAIQPSLVGSSARPRIVKRAAGATTWRLEPMMPRRFDLDNDIVVLRMYGGYTAEAHPIFSQALLTEDDYLHGLLGPEGLKPPSWMADLLARPRTQPGLFVGLSVLDWRHRLLLRWLYDQRPAPAESVAILTPKADPSEPEVWDSGGGLPGAGRIAPIVGEPAELAPLLGSLEAGIDP